jgi:hypothetical protein
MIIHGPIISGSLTFAAGGSITLPATTTYASSGLVSGSEQITLSSTTGYNANEHFTQANITTLGTVTSGNVTAILPDGIISGSIQVDGSSVSTNNINIGGVSIALGGNDATPALNLSDATQYPGDSNLVTLGTITAGSVNAILPDGVVSGSAQLTSDFDTRYLNTNGDGVVSGSAQISLGGFDTDNLSEGSSNLYYTDARTRAAISAAGDLSYDSGTGVISFTNDAGDIESVTAGTGLTGGGSTGALTINVIGGDGITANADNITVDATVLRTEGNGVVSGSSQITLSSTTGYDSNENIDHTSVSVTAGTGLTGGGTIAATRTINVVGGDGITANADDIQVDATVLRTEGMGIISGSSQVSHDSSTGFVANEHIDHTSVSITAGSGLTGGGTIASTRTLNVIGGDGITANADNITVDGTVLRTTGNGVVSGSAQISGQSVTSPAAIYDDGGTPTLRSGITQGELQTAIGVDVSAITANTAKISYNSAASTKLATIEEGADVNVVDSVAGKTGTVSLVKGDVGLGNVDNTADSAKPVSTAQQTEIDTKADLASPTFTGTPLAPTPAANTNTTQIATTAYVQTELTDLIGGAPGTLDTLNELAAAINDDSDYSSTLTTALGTKLVKSSNLSDLTSAETARTNLGLGSAAVSDTGDFLASSVTTISGAQASAITANTAKVSNIVQTTVSGNAGSVTNGVYTTGTQTIGGAKSFSSAVNIDATTASTSKTTGALIVDGGVGIAGALNVGGDIVAFASSDERLKDNIELISNPIEKVQSLKGVTWDWNSNADELQQSLPNVGVIAQDVEKILPQLVIDRDNGFKGVDYAKLTGLLIEAVKDQQKQIDELKSKLS